MKKKLSKYITTTIIALAFVFLIAFVKGVFDQKSAKDVLHILVDSSFSIGIVLFCFGVITLAANGGTFDMLAFGVIKLLDLFRRNPTDGKYRTFYEYRKTKQESPAEYLFLIVIGAGITAVSLILLVFYYQY